MEKVDLYNKKESFIRNITMLIIYTGNGKGKTSASVGQCIRAYGQNMQVCFGQFMKSNKETGEQLFLASLLKERFYIGGIGFFLKEEDRPLHEEAAKKTLAWAHEKIMGSEKLDMLVLDEALYALGSKLLTQEEIENLIKVCQEKDVHLVLSGRGAPDWLIEKADTVSSIEVVKHACEKGIAAARGIEF